MTAAVAYVPYLKREGFEDLEPVAQDDGSDAVASIAYTPEYRDAMDTFRALVKRNEKSERVLKVTEDVIKLNAAHYSIWAYRSATLLAIKADLEKELDWMEELMGEHLKTYQVWQHRRNIVLALNSPSRELPFISRVLALDAKNYNTWVYRQWVLSHFDDEFLWSGELKFVEGLLASDIRNNSAWNHRWLCSFERGDKAGDGEAVKIREIEFCKEQLTISPNNPSAWNYLRGILNRTSTPYSTLSSFVRPLARLPNDPKENKPEGSETSEEERDLDPPQALSFEFAPSPLATEFLADGLAQEVKGLDSSFPQRKEKAKEAEMLYTLLSESLDPIRARYWTYKKSKVST